MRDKLKAALEYLGTNWCLHPKSTYVPKWGKPEEKFYTKPFLSVWRM